MKTLIRMTTSLIAAALMSGAPLFAQAQSTQTQVQSQDWNTPPEGSEQQGYRDGIQAAQLDKAAKRKIDAKSSHLYVHPPVKRAARDEYRTSFVAGYEAAVRHISGE
jgi:hypothetical protein